MRLTKDLIQHSYTSARQYILSHSVGVSFRGQNDFMTWELFFNTSTQDNASAVDVCTSALGVLSVATQLSGQGELEQIASDAITRGIKTLLKVRAVDGSWPSSIELLQIENTIQEGVVNDTFFALSSLLNVGFLKETPTLFNPRDISPNSTIKADDFNSRYEFIKKSVEWLLNNKAGAGWQFISTQSAEGEADKTKVYVLPTSNVLSILSDIKSELSNTSKSKEINKLLEPAIIATTTWFCDNANSDGGFGNARGMKSLPGTTAMVIRALSSVNVATPLNARIKETIISATKWLIANYNPKKIRYEDVINDYRQYYLVIDPKTRAKTGFKYKGMEHETFVEPIVIDALYAFWGSYPKGSDERKKLGKFPFTKLERCLYKASNYLINLQAGNGDFAGAVKSRRQGKYTMYSTSDLVRVFSLLLKRTELINKVLTANMRYKISVLGNISVLLTTTACGFLSGVTALPLYVAAIIFVVGGIGVNFISSKFDSLLK
jgi:hypothetical protein